MNSMTHRPSQAAPRWRQALAALLDVALFGGVAWLVRSRAKGGVARANRQSWMRLLPAEFVRERLRSPGQRMLGLRTVDRRSGRQVELWRTLVLLGANAGGQLLARRLTPPVPSPARARELERFSAELAAIYERHRDDHAAAEAERRELFERHPGPISVDFWRAAGPSLAIGLINNRLRRRLAPTSEVLARRVDLTARKSARSPRA
jgi:hypothetical protein